MKKKKVYLTLENGKVMQGYRFGADGESTGELVFNTNMVGYLETLTDPCYYGQIVVQTFPLIGNYGVMNSDLQAEKSYLKAYVVREICAEPSNFRCEGKLDEYLKKEGIVGIYGVDTRELTKIIRENGVMNAVISNRPYEGFATLSALDTAKNAVAAVAPMQKQIFGENEKGKIALWNFGCKRSLIESFVNLGLQTISFPATTTAEEILAEGVDGIVISDGPGNPAENVVAIGEIKKLLGQKPMFASGLGHQMVALAVGGKVVKMKYGHRGGNQPVKMLKTGRVYASEQNHGYEVVADDALQGSISFINVNDGGVEGVEYPQYKAVTVQFNPASCSACTGEENPLFTQFLAAMAKERK